MVTQRMSGGVFYRSALDMHVRVLVGLVLVESAMAVGVESWSGVSHCVVFHQGSVERSSDFALCHG